MYVDVYMYVPVLLLWTGRAHTFTRACTHNAHTTHARAMKKKSSLPSGARGGVRRRKRRRYSIDGCVGRFMHVDEPSWKPIEP